MQFFEKLIHFRIRPEETDFHFQPYYSGKSTKLLPLKIPSLYLKAFSWNIEVIKMTLLKFYKWRNVKTEVTFSKKLWNFWGIIVAHNLWKYHFNRLKTFWVIKPKRSQKQKMSPLTFQTVCLLHHQMSET